MLYAVQPKMCVWPDDHPIQITPVYKDREEQKRSLGHDVQDLFLTSTRQLLVNIWE
jgi:hypothetical protein